MPACITLTNLCYSTADARPVFSDLNLTFGPERTGVIGRNGVGKSTLLKVIAGHLHPTSGGVTSRGKIAFMHQDAMQSPADTIVDLFGETAAYARLSRAEAGTASLDDFAQANWDLPAQILAALTRCGVPMHPLTPLAHLSGGQRNRVSLAAMIFSAPDVLILDEPTNNLDRAARETVIALIRTWKGGLILASHDRALLNEMDAIVALTAQSATRYGGNYDSYQVQKQRARAAAQQALSDAQKDKDNAARKAQIATERKARKDSIGKKSRAKGDQPKSLLDAAKERSESSGGAGARLRDARRQEVEDALTKARDSIEVLTPVHIDIPHCALPQTKQVLTLSDVSGGYGDHDVIRGVSLQITGPERVHLTGANGRGKSTLLRLISGALSPRLGTVDHHVPIAMLDQDLCALQARRSLLQVFMDQNPTQSAQTAHDALARFGFRAQNTHVAVDQLSGGERLRAALACVLGAKPTPQLLLLDEPTNHLDLDAVSALETALQHYDGAMIAVSHDPTFVQKLEVTRTITL